MDDKSGLINLRLDSLEQILTDVWSQLRFLEKTILEVKRGVELMTVREIEKPLKRTFLEYQVSSLAEGSSELERRVEHLEKQVSLMFALLRVVGIILLVFASVYVASVWF